MTASTEADDGSFEDKLVIDIDEWNYADLPDKNFYLPAFGLAELDQESYQDSNPFPAYCLALGVGFGLVAALLEFRR